MTFRALCMYNGSIHDCVSFNFVELQQLQNSANQNEALSPLGDFVVICRGDCQHCISRWWQRRGADLTAPSCSPCHIPTLLSVGGSFQSSNLFRTDCMLGPVINHRWIGGSVFLCLKQPWTLINVTLRSQNNCQRTYAHEKLFQCKRWLCPAPFVSPLPSSLSYSLPGLTWPSANWLWGRRPGGFDRHPWGHWEPLAGLAPGWGDLCRLLGLGPWLLSVCHLKTPFFILFLSFLSQWIMCFGW